MKKQPPSPDPTIRPLLPSPRWSTNKDHSKSKTCTIQAAKGLSHIV